MEIEDQIEWLKPERIEKLCGSEKNIFGINRMLIIGIGKNGVDCVLRCKHITERRFGTDGTKMRFLGIGESGLLDSSECYGSRLADDEKLSIVPEDSIYKYLNNPARLPQYALDWFDSGLKNYSPATPTYGLTKRQCGRVALFHYIKPLFKRLGESISAFAGTDRSLEIVITGNLGDVFFGGMFIDLAYIIKSLFEDSSYPYKVNAMLFAGDTAELFETDQRELGNYYANTIITKNELDLFQVRKARFSQRYSSSFEVISDKPPFSSVFIAQAGENYGLTIGAAAEKILSRMAVLFSKDDDAERIMSYNMLKPNESHDFRYLAFDTRVTEVPVGKILSYLSVKVFTVFNRLLNKNSVGQSQLGQYASQVTPNAMYLASRAGSIPELEFDEKVNPTFSPRALKISSDSSMNYVEDWLKKIVGLTAAGAEQCLPDITDEIITTCENAKNDLSKGPFYSIEIIKKCLAELRVAMAKIKSDADDMREQIERSRGLCSSAYMKVKTSALFAGKAAEQYIEELKDFAEYSREYRTSDALMEMYRKMYDKFNDYLENTLNKKAEMFEKIAVNRAAIIDRLTEERDDTVVRDAFSMADPTVRGKLDELVEQLSEEALAKSFKNSHILELPEDDETALAREMAEIVTELFRPLLGMKYSEMCAFFGIENAIGNGLERCLEQAEVTVPVADDFPLNRVICPKSTDMKQIAPIRSVHRSINYIWNASVLNYTAEVVQIRGGVKLEEFKDYEKWENMRYAYVNDSLKKHGIHIFA